MCSHRPNHSHHRSDDASVSERERQAVIDAIGRNWAGGRLDAEEYETRVAQAASAATHDDLRTALGDGEPVGSWRSAPGAGWRPHLPAPIVLFAAIAVVALAGMAAFGFHPAFFWIVPLVGFKLARFHGRRWWRAQEERTIPV